MNVPTIDAEKQPQPFAGVALSAVVEQHVALLGVGTLGSIFADRLLELDTILDVLRHTDAQSYWLFNYLAPRLARQDFDDGFAIDLQHKDLKRCKPKASVARISPRPPMSRPSNRASAA